MLKRCGRGRWRHGRSRSLSYAHQCGRNCRASKRSADTTLPSSHVVLASCGGYTEWDAVDVGCCKPIGKECELVCDCLRLALQRDGLAVAVAVECAVGGTCQPSPWV